MKKIISLLLMAAMLLSTAVCFAEVDTTAMEKSLVAVKGKIDIPEDMKSFTSNSREYDGDVQFEFNWKDDSENQIRVTADSEGHISSYRCDVNGMYEDSPILSSFSKDEYKDAAVSFMKKSAPELFINDGDHLVISDEFQGEKYRYSNEYVLHFAREKDGVEVKDNGASICVYEKGKEIHVRYFDINWDYKTEFISSDEKISDPQAVYNEMFPVELVYRDDYTYYYRNDYNPEISMVYTIRDKNCGYIDAKTGGKVEPEPIARPIYTDGLMAAESSADGAADKNMALSPEEISELDTVKTLFDKNKIYEILKNIPQLKIGKNLTILNSSLYKQDDDYYIRINLENKDKQYVNVLADAMTGEIQNFSNYYISDKYNSIEPSKTQIENANAQINSFLNNNYKEKLSECEKRTEYDEDNNIVSYVRILNGIPYINDGISVNYDFENNCISSFSVNWNKDTLELSEPKDALEAKKALEIIYNDADFDLEYIRIDDKFILTYTLKKPGFCEIDGITGENTNKNEIYSYEYTDIKDHWAYDKISALSNIGVGLKTDELKPDSGISQEDCLRLFSSYFYGEYVVSCDRDGFYDRMENNGIIEEDEINPDALISRQAAFGYLIRFMGHKELASLNEIYKTNYADEYLIDKNLIGSIAILRGMNIISGDSENIRPTDDMTRAEAFCVLYNYLSK